jgi:hypothetical protein
MSQKLVYLGQIMIPAVVMVRVDDVKPHRHQEFGLTVPALEQGAQMTQALERALDLFFAACLAQDMLTGGHEVMRSDL